MRPGADGWGSHGCEAFPGPDCPAAPGDVLWLTEGGREPRALRIEQLTPPGFRPFGQVLTELAGGGGVDIGTGRFWKDVLPIHRDAPAAGIIQYDPRALSIQRMERHPRSGQTFVSLSPGDALLALAPDIDGEPDLAGLHLFRVGTGEGFRLAPGTWHASPFPLEGGTLRFLVIMKPGTIGEGTEWYPLPSPLIMAFENPDSRTSGS